MSSGGKPTERDAPSRQGIVRTSATAARATTSLCGGGHCGFARYAPRGWRLKLGRLAR